MTDTKRTSISAPTELTLSERLDAFIRLYTQELERQKQVESIQWRINFSVWTFIILATHALTEANIHHRVGFVAGGAALALLHFVAIVKNVRSVRTTAQLARDYRDCADAMLRSPEQKPSIKDDVSGWFNHPRWWVVAIFGTTLFLVAVSLVLLW